MRAHHGGEADRWRARGGVLLGALLLVLGSCSGDRPEVCGSWELDVQQHGAELEALGKAAVGFASGLVSVEGVRLEVEGGGSWEAEARLDGRPQPWRCAGSWTEEGAFFRFTLEEQDGRPAERTREMPPRWRHHGMAWVEDGALVVEVELRGRRHTLRFARR